MLFAGVVNAQGSRPVSMQFKHTFSYVVNAETQKFWIQRTEPYSGTIQFPESKDSGLIRLISGGEDIILCNCKGFERIDGRYVYKCSRNQAEILAFFDANKQTLILDSEGKRLIFAPSEEERPEFITLHMGKPWPELKPEPEEVVEKPVTQKPVAEKPVEKTTRPVPTAMAKPLLYASLFYSIPPESSITDRVDRNPKFKGGQIALIRYLGQNMRYPQEAKDQNIQGSVLVDFVVDHTGKVKDVKIAKGLGGGCDEEALRLFRQMPPWEPGEKDGRKVDTQMNFPLNFTLR